MFHTVWAAPLYSTVDPAKVVKLPVVDVRVVPPNLIVPAPVSVIVGLRPVPLWVTFPVTLNKPDEIVIKCL